MLALALVFSLFGAVLCGAVAAHKNISVLGYTLLGVVLPLIGVIAVLVAEPAPAAERSS